MEPAIWGLIGTVVGAFASIATTYIQSRYAEALRTVATKEERDGRRRAFQRETLIELQDVLHDLCRMVVRGHLEDNAHYRKVGAWGQNPLSDEVNEGQRVLRRRAMLLTSRVSNDELRQSIRASLETLVSFSMARSYEEASHWHIQMNNESPKVLESIGHELRSQY
jgi:hypothetical protein